MAYDFIIKYGTCNRNRGFLHRNDGSHFSGISGFLFRIGGVKSAGILKNIGSKEMEENKRMGALRMKATDVTWGFL